jgi:hypothetical protein
MARKRERRKSDAEARVERMTWALLVVAYALFELLPQATTGALPNWFVPVAGAVILLGSGMYQYARRWRVNPVTWIAGAVMLFFSLYNVYMNRDANFLGLSLAVFAGVIVFGIITNET